MERTDTHIRHGRLRGVAGFSLIELLIGLAISSILALSLWSLASTQERTYGSQDSATEMQQNLRAALQCLTRDIMAAGLGPQSSTINGQNAGAWYNAANKWNAFNITATSIDIIGWPDARDPECAGCERNQYACPCRRRGGGLYGLPEYQHRGRGERGGDEYQR